MPSDLKLTAAGILAHVLETSGIQVGTTIDRKDLENMAASLDGQLADLLATAKREAEQAKQITQLQNSAGFCEKHPPGNGHRRCLVCGCIELSFALSQIDYAISEPNEMGVSTYDVFPYPDTVVDRVKKKIAEQAAYIERLNARVRELEEALTNVDAKVESIARTALGKEERT